MCLSGWYSRSQTSYTMYFILTDLSILDLCYTTSTDHHMLINICCNKKTISYGGWPLVLLSVYPWLLCPLIDMWQFAGPPLSSSHQYYYASLVLLKDGSLLMAHRLQQLSAAILLDPQNAMLWPSGRDHFCEVPAFLNLTCWHKAYWGWAFFFFGVLILLIPVVLILISYSFIVKQYWEQVSRRMKKAFGTCGSHMVVVSVFPRIATYIYLQTPLSTSKDWGKMVSLFYGIIRFMLKHPHLIEIKILRRPSSLLEGEEPRWQRD